LQEEPEQTVNPAVAAAVQSLMRHAGVAGGPHPGREARMMVGMLEERKDGLAPARRTILVVDDETQLREVLALALELEGYAVVQAADGVDALLALQGGALPDAIVLDLEMPLMPGWEFRAAQLRDPAIAGIPVLVLSASPHPVAADRRLPKPSRLEDLLGAIRSLVGPP
jgi:CheY-like chemotaxis protein